jgi:zinc/manganese transport system permease protein
VSFAGSTGALATGVNPLAGLGIVNGLSAVIIGVLGRRERGRDVVVGVVLTTALGLGLLFLRLSRAQAAVPVLVGDVLGVSHIEVVVTTIATAGVLLAVAAAYRPLLFSSLDEEIAEARGVSVALMSVVLLVILAVTTSVATPIVGVLLTFALLVGPAATAAILSPRPPRAMALSVALSVVYVWVGLAVSYWVDFPPSVFVTGMALAVYLGARLFRDRLSSGGSGR